MKIRTAKRILLMSLIAATLSGCVTYPIAKNLQKQAQPLTLSQVAADPGACQGKVVIWGGRIIKTVNDVNSSALYILKLPLDRSGKPRLNVNTSGRFIASSKEFLDPEVYKSGRLVTVAGTVAGLETQPVQKAKYDYPVVDIKQLHIWRVERRYYYYYPAWGWGYYPYYPYYGGWYPGWGVGWGWYYHGGYWGGGYHYHDDGGHWGGGYHHGGSHGGGHWHAHH